MRKKIPARPCNKLRQMREHLLAGKAQLIDDWRQTLEERLEQSFGIGQELGESDPLLH